MTTTRITCVAAVAASLLMVAASGSLLAQAGGAAPGAAGQGRATAAAPSATTTLTSPVTGNAVSGKKLYYAHACYSCHGYTGETGARAFVPNWPANLATERSFIAFLRGRANVAPLQPSTSMPNYPVESLSDAQARDVYAFIRSFTSTPPPLEKIPTMTQILAEAQKPYKK